MQAGVQVTQQQEKLVLNALMCQQPAESAHTASGRLEECGDAESWGAGLRTEWVTLCHQRPGQDLLHVTPPHRLYVQAAPGEMRLATVMIAAP